MATFRFDERFVAPEYFNRIADLEDDEIYYDVDALPIVPPSFDDIVITECLHATRNSSVYSGYMVDEDGARYEHDIAFKFGDVDRLCREAEKYDRMVKLQGTAIPRLIGLAFGTTKTGENLACLMTELFGSSSIVLSFVWRGQRSAPPITMLAVISPLPRAIILNHLQAIHNKGLLHADFKESNVLQRGADFRLVDFDHMRESHSCSAPHQRPDFSDMPEHITAEVWTTVCAYIIVHAEDMDFWDDGTVDVDGFTWNKEGLPTGRIMHDLFPRIYYYRYKTKELPDLLWHYFRHIQTLLEDGAGDVQSLKARIDETAAWVETQWRAKVKLPPLPPVARPSPPPRRRVERQSNCNASQITVY
ncbi:hypothetical protein BDZ89DRAFT_1072809 [Hymenopellis radicata]|nr:hypothetical protein BDZ89DRAFT_1072809 [Hymenopellis radicata]